jgi:Adenylate and Guanylate cyclase catalytic domain
VGTPAKKTAIGPTKAAASTTVSSTKSLIIVAADDAASEAIEGERKTVTALFADIKGSTELMEDLDPEEARAIIDLALKLMIEAVRRYDGYVVQSIGDGSIDRPQRVVRGRLDCNHSFRTPMDQDILGNIHYSPKRCFEHYYGATLKVAEPPPSGAAGGGWTKTG